jgi:hypothetical protein
LKQQKALQATSVFLTPEDLSCLFCCLLIAAVEKFLLIILISLFSKLENILLFIDGATYLGMHLAVLVGS